MDATDLFSEVRVVPVVVIEEVAMAVPLAETLRDAGIGAIEVTLRTEAGLPAITRIAREVPGIIIGAGSVRHPQQFGQIVDAGARFAVSPGATDELLEAADSASLPFVPGATTASEVLSLLQQGYQFQKFFPAELIGGIQMIKALSAPIAEVSFFPTGGITLALARDYLALPNVRCVGGSWFVPTEALRAGDFKKITSLAIEAASV